MNIDVKPYITIKRFKNLALTDDHINLPYGTEVNCIYLPNLNNAGFLIYEKTPLCKDSSQIAYDYFSRNDDGNGLERGKLVQSIISTLSERDPDYQNRWDKIWDDESLRKFKRVEFADDWIWNFEFYNAEIEDLRYIADLVGAKV